MKKLSENDREIILAYANLPFPHVLYDMDGLRYINDLHSMLRGYCQRLLVGASLKMYTQCDEEDALIEEEFKRAINETEGADKDEMIIRYHFYNIIRIIILKYKRANEGRKPDSQ